MHRFGKYRPLSCSGGHLRVHAGCFATCFVCNRVPCSSWVSMCEPQNSNVLLAANSQGTINVRVAIACSVHALICPPRLPALHGSAAGWWSSLRWALCWMPRQRTLWRHQSVPIYPLPLRCRACVHLDYETRQVRRLCPHERCMFGRAATPPPAVRSVHVSITKYPRCQPSGVHGIHSGSTRTRTRTRTGYRLMPHTTLHTLHPTLHRLSRQHTHSAGTLTLDELYAPFGDLSPSSLNVIAHTLLGLLN